MVAAISIAQIDAAIEKAAGDHWQKTAMVIARVDDLLDPKKHHRISLERVARRIVRAVKLGRLAAEGDLSQWRSSEIRRVR